MDDKDLPIIKNDYTKYYFGIGNIIKDRIGESSNVLDGLVYSYILSWANGTFASNKTIADRFGVSESAVKSSVKRLADNNLIWKTTKLNKQTGFKTRTMKATILANTRRWNWVKFRESSPQELKDRGMSPTINDLMVYNIIYGLNASELECTYSNSQLADLVLCDEKTIRRCLSKLSTCGAISIYEDGNKVRHLRASHVIVKRSGMSKEEGSAFMDITFDPKYSQTKNACVYAIYNNNTGEIIHTGACTNFSQRVATYTHYAKTLSYNNELFLRMHNEGIDNFTFKILNEYDNMAEAWAGLSGVNTELSYIPVVNKQDTEDGIPF